MEKPFSHKYVVENGISNFNASSAKLGYSFWTFIYFDLYFCCFWKYIVESISLLPEINLPKWELKNDRTAGNRRSVYYNNTIPIRCTIRYDDKEKKRSWPEMRRTAPEHYYNRIQILVDIRLSGQRRRRSRGHILKQTLKNPQSLFRNTSRLKTDRILTGRIFVPFYSFFPVLFPIKRQIIYIDYNIYKININVEWKYVDVDKSFDDNNHVPTRDGN